MGRLCLSGVPARAGIIYSGFGPGYSYECCSAWVVSGADASAGPLAPAMGFTAAISGDVSQIDVALSVYTGTGNVTVSLWTDVGGFPGSQLGSWDVTATQSYDNCCAVVTIPVVAGPSITAGQTYFLAAVPDSATDLDFWNEEGIPGQIAWSRDGWSTPYYNEIGPLGAFDILGGASTPEPATAMLLGTGLLALLARRRRAR